MGKPLALDIIEAAFDSHEVDVMFVDMAEFCGELASTGNDSVSQDRYLLIFRKLRPTFTLGFGCTRSSLGACLHRNLGQLNDVSLLCAVAYFE